MNSSQLLKLGGVLAVLGLMVLVFQAAREGNIEQPGSQIGKDRIFKKFPVNDVTHVGIVSQDGELNLERQESGWAVKERNDYPADVEKIGKFLTSIFDLGAVQSVPVGASKYGRVGLLSPAEKEGSSNDEEDDTLATIVSFKKGDDLVSELWIGKEYQKTQTGQFGPTQSTTGRYIKRGDSDDVFVVDETFNDLEPKPEEWLDDGFFKVAKVKTIERIPAENPEEGWKLTRTDDKADFTLEGASEDEELDNTKVSSMKSAFASPSFEDVMIGEGVEEPNKVTFKIQTLEGFKYEVKVNDKNEENEYLLTLSHVSADLPKERAAAEDESEEDKETKDKEFKEQRKDWLEKLESEKRLIGHIYKVRGFVADSINKNRSELMKEPEEEEEGENSETSIPGVEGGVPGIGN